MTIKFESFRIDLEDENKGDINKMISKVAKEAYNRGVSDSQDALLGIDAMLGAQEQFAIKAENAICANYVK